MKVNCESEGELRTDGEQCDYKKWTKAPLDSRKKQRYAKYPRSFSNPLTFHQQLIVLSRDLHHEVFPGYMSACCFEDRGLLLIYKNLRIGRRFFYF